MFYFTNIFSARTSIFMLLMGLLMFSKDREKNVVQMGWSLAECR